MKIIIAGFGVVGKSIKERFFKEADIYDTKLGYDYNEERYDCCIVCVPTDLVNGQLDTTEVAKVIEKIDAKYFLIKSTLPVGFSDSYPNVLFSPEFSGSTPHSQNVDDGFTIVGATTREQRQFITDLFYKNNSMLEHKIYFTNNKEAELLKLTENTYLGYIVTFATEMYKVCDKYNVDWNIISELLRLDKRMPQSHTHVFKNQLYYSSHCLDKDIPHLARDSDLFSYIEEYNNRKKRECNGLL